MCAVYHQYTIFAPGYAHIVLNHALIYMYVVCIWPI